MVNVSSKEKKFRLLFALFIFCFFSVLSAEGQQTSASERPNIVWLVTEDNSKHFMNLYEKGGAIMPNIEALAARGIVFDRAFSNAPVCSVARSTLISGCYAPRIGAQYHRKAEEVSLPDGLKMFPHYLQEAGYYTTNNAKEDYNILREGPVWNESSGNASYKNRAPGQPFFHVQNYGITHEGKLHFTAHEMDSIKTKTDPATVTPFPYHPDNDIFRYSYAKLLDHHLIADSLMGLFLNQLEDEGLMESTIVFYYGDHGGVLPGSKGYLYESGLHVPLVVYIPPKWSHLFPLRVGNRTDAFVSFVDFGPTVLNLAGISVPKSMDGRPFMGEEMIESDLDSRKTAFGYADRFDEKYEMVRSFRKGRYKYIRNYQPMYPDGLFNFYRYRMLAYQSWKMLFQQGKLNADQQKFFLPKGPEQLYDLQNDPFELNDLSGIDEYGDVLVEMRSALTAVLKKMPDLSFYPEPHFLRDALPDVSSFAMAYHQDIISLIDIADLQLLPYSDARLKIAATLESDSQWKRYWGYMVCSAFGDKAVEFTDLARQAVLEEEENLVRFRAAEFLALSGDPQGVDQLVACLNMAEGVTEANLILNTFAVLKDLGSEIPIERIKMVIRPAWSNQTKTLVDHRIEYLESN